MKDQEASSIEQALVHGWYYLHGYPRVIVSDQGRNVDGERVVSFSIIFPPIYVQGVVQSFFWVQAPRPTIFARSARVATPLLHG